MSPRAPITRFTSRYVLLPTPNIDTDQIIPARFLTTTERTGLGPQAFHDWRYGPDGSPNPDFALNRPGAAGAEILVAGENFGCGSSREHAVWALQGAGFRAVVSERFGDIFRANALGNGLLPIVVPPEAMQVLADLAGARLAAELTVDLEARVLHLPDGSSVAFPVPPFSRYCLMNGVDELEFLMGAGAEIGAYERDHPARVATLALGRASA